MMKRIFAIALALLLLMGGAFASAAAPDLPAAFTASKGISYRLLPAGTQYAYGSFNEKIAAFSDGLLVAKKLGKTTVHASTVGEGGAQSKCKVTVIPNTFTRKKPLKGAGAGVFTSTKRLYYKNGSLYVELFILNRTGAKLRGAENLKFELFDGGKLVYSRDIAAWKPKKALANKKHATYKLRIPETELGGTRLDLGNKQVQAQLSGGGFVGVK